MQCLMRVFSPICSLDFAVLILGTISQHNDKDFLWNPNHLFYHNFLSFHSGSFPVVVICLTCLLLFCMHFKKLFFFPVAFMCFLNVSHFYKSVQCINNYIIVHELKASLSLGHCLYIWEGQQELRCNQSTLQGNTTIQIVAF